MSGITWEHVQPSKSDSKVDTATVHDRALHASDELMNFLHEAAMAEEAVTLVVNDPYRGTQTRSALSALHQLLSDTVSAPGSSAAIPADGPGFQVLVATGTHVVTPERRREFEEQVLFSSGLRVEGVAWHDCHLADRLKELNGYFFHPLIFDSRFLMPIGSVEPHYFAGVTGPHKTVTIGCLSHADIERNHYHALHPESDILRLEGNPVYDSVGEMVDTLKSSGKRICAIAQVVCGESVAHVAVGGVVESVKALVPAVRKSYMHTVDARVDVLHLRVAPPLSANLYQADKALKNNHRAVRDGGAIILEADCLEGTGPEQFIRLLQESSDYASARRVVSERGYRLGDHKAVKIRHLIDPAHRGVRVVILSPHLSEQEMDGTGLRVVAGFDAALDAILHAASDPVRRGLVVEDAGNMCVFARND